MSEPKKITKAEQTRQRLAGVLEHAKQLAVTKRRVFDKPLMQDAYDWGDYKKQKLVRHKSDGTYDVCSKPLEEEIRDRASEGAKSVVIEASFGSFDLREKLRVLEAAKECGVTVYVTPTKQTERFRRNVLGLEEDDKSEEIDAMCIFEMANYHPTHVALAKPPSEEQIAKQAARRSTPSGKALVLRSLRWPDRECESFMRYLSAPPDYVESSYLYDSEREEFKANWCVPIVAAAVEVLQAGGDRSEFDRRCGYYAFGYGSFLRSNHYHGMLSRVVKARFDVGNNKDMNSLNQEEVKRVRNEESTKLRRASRWIYSQVRRGLAL